MRIVAELDLIVAFASMLAAFVSFDLTADYSVCCAAWENIASAFVAVADVVQSTARVDVARWGCKTVAAELKNILAGQWAATD